MEKSSSVCFLCYGKYVGIMLNVIIPAQARPIMKRGVSPLLDTPVGNFPLLPIYERGRYLGGESIRRAFRVPGTRWRWGVPAAGRHCASSICSYRKAAP